MSSRGDKGGGDGSATNTVNETNCGEEMEETSTMTTVKDEKGVKGEEEDDEDEVDLMEVKADEKDDVDGGGDGHNVNSSHDNIPNDHNDNCATADDGDSLPPATNTTLQQQLPERPTPAEGGGATTEESDTMVTVAEYGVVEAAGNGAEKDGECAAAAAVTTTEGRDGEVVTDNKTTSALPAAAVTSVTVRIPSPAATAAAPFPMPSPSAKPRTPGILRLDTSGKKSRRSSGISSTVEFRNDPEMLGESTPTSSNPISPQLSVTWAFQRDSYGGGGGGGGATAAGVGGSSPAPAADHDDKGGRQSVASVEEESSQQQPYHRSKFREVFGRRIRAKNKREEARCAPVKPPRTLPDPLLFMETSRFNSLDAGPVDSEDEDYSQSVSAIMQRRASTHRGRSRRGKSPRRSSSPLVVANHNAHYGNNSHATMNNTNAAPGGGGGGSGGTAAAAAGGDGDRRRSSVYTTSSGDTAISFEDDGNKQNSSKEQIVENIRLHKEVLQSVKYQTWSMRRKLRLVRQAKSYVARHEGALQERYAKSRNTRDLWARFKLFVAAKMQHIRRELTNISTQLIPWESRIKEIESHFGSVVASYFTFLRWLLWVNIVIAFAIALFVVVPEVVSTDLKGGPGYKRLLEGEIKGAGYLATAVAFEGYLKYSALFYGYYSNISEVAFGYKLPLAYFLTGLAIYIYSFIATLRKMAKNSRMSKLSSKDDECIFSWKLFTGWDFLIGHAETAHNRIASVVLGFKEALLEEAEKKKSKGWKIIGIRIIVNMLVLALLCASAYAVIYVVERSTDEGGRKTWLKDNEITICITFISHVFPIMFDLLGCFESYHPRKQLRLQLARIMFLNLLTLYALIFAQFVKIGSLNKQSEEIRLYLMRAQMDSDGCIPWPPPSPIQATTPIPYAAFSEQFLSQFTDDPQSYAEVTDNPLALMDSPINKVTKMINWSTSVKGAETSEGDWSEFGTTTMSPFGAGCYRVIVDCVSATTTTSLTTVSPDLWNTTLPTAFTTLLAIVTMLSTLSGNSSTANVTDPMDYELPFNGDWNVTEFSNETISSMMTTTTTDFPSYDDDGDGDVEGKISGRKKLTTTEPDYYYDLQDGGRAPAASGFREELERFRRSLDQMAEGDVEGLDWMQAINNVSWLLENANLTENGTQLMMLMGNLTEYDELGNFTTLSSSTSTELPVESVTEFVTRLLMETTTTDKEDEEGEAVVTTTEEPCYKIICENDTESTVAETDTQPTTDFTSTTTSSSTPTTTTTESAWRMYRPPTRTTTDATPTTVIAREKFESSTIGSDESLTNSSEVYSTFPPIPRLKVINKTEVEELLRRSELLPANAQAKIRNLCWETMFGREILKLNVMDIILFCLSVFCMDFLRALFVRFMNKCWCWDLEKKFPRYNDFKIAENILHLINNQGLVWMGMFFSPGLAIINMMKLIIILYLRSWAVLTCNVPHSVVFRASRSNNFYLGLLLTMLFLCVLPVAYMIVWIEPSWHCGPFSKHKQIAEIFTKTVRANLPSEFHFALDRIASSSTVIPMLMLLILIIYYLVSLTNALREANEDLRNQLRRERMEERRKMLKLTEQKQLEAQENNAPISLRWRKVLDSASSPLTPTNAGGVIDAEEAQKIQEKKERLQRIMKKALRKSSATSDEESVVGVHHHHHQQQQQQNNHPDDENTDTEQHESLPHDQEEEDNKINTQKQSTTSGGGGAGGEKKRDLFPELIKKLRESAKKSKAEAAAAAAAAATSSGTIIDVQPQKKGGQAAAAAATTESTDDDERVVRERRKSLLRRGMKPSGDPETTVGGTGAGEAKFDVIDETSGGGGGGGGTTKVIGEKTKKSKSKASVFTFDVPGAANTDLISSSDNDAAATAVTTTTRRGTAAAAVSPKSPISATVNKAKKSPADAPNDDSLKGKFNSFFTIVKEAVHARRQSLIAEQQMDDAMTSMSNEESSVTRRSKASTQPGSVSPKPPISKRDSDCSIWSDNIPVITISKTGSDECILEEDKKASSTQSSDGEQPQSLPIEKVVTDDMAKNDEREEKQEKEEDEEVELRKHDEEVVEVE